VEAIKRDGILWKPTLPFFSCVFLVSYVAGMELLFSEEELLSRSFQFWIVLTFVVIYESRRKAPRTLEPVFWTMIVTYPIWQFNTIETLLGEHAHVARIIIRSSDEAKDLTSRGIGGYGLVYSTVLMIPALFCYLQARMMSVSSSVTGYAALKRNILLILVLVNIVMGVALVLTAGYLIALGAMSLSLVVAFWYREASFFRTIIIIIGLVLFAFYGSDIIEKTLISARPLVEGTSLSRKIDDTLLTMHLGSATGTLAERRERYMRSVNAFFESPIIGVVDFDLVGKESHFMDMFARWGVLVGLINVYTVLFLPWRLLRSPYYESSATVGIFVAAVIVFLLNNAFMAAGAVLFVIVPVLLQYARSESNSSVCRS